MLSDLRLSLRLMANTPGFSVAPVGITAGLLLGLGANRFLASSLHGLQPFDPLVLLGAAVLACWLPARKATKVSPLTALRAE